MMAGMELDLVTPFPVAKPTAAGDVVLYSDRAIGATAPPAGAVLGSRAVSGWYQTDVASTLKVQEWDAVNKAWVTVNGVAGAGISVAGGALCLIRTNRIGGQMQIITTLAGTPATWKGPSGMRLHQEVFATETP